jgi:hypothetical protein
MALSKREPGPNRINYKQAIALLKMGMNYRQVGIELARRQGRIVPYLPGSIQSAVKRYDLKRV